MAMAFLIVARVPAFWASAQALTFQLITVSASSQRRVACRYFLILAISRNIENLLGCSAVKGETHFSSWQMFCSLAI